MYGPNPTQRAEYYKHEAERARREATRALAPDIKESYLKLAEAWTRLARTPTEFEEN